MGKAGFRETRHKGIPQDKPHDPSSPNSRRYRVLRAIKRISHIAKRAQEPSHEESKHIFELHASTLREFA
jgi:hypothetical protein